MPHVNPTKLLRTSLLTLGLLGILHSNIQAGEIEQKAFVERFYQNILNRSSDTTGMTTWMDTIKTKSATQVAMGFLNSPELTNKNLSNEEFLDIMYQTMFDRLADNGGRNDWLEKMRNGRTKQSVMFGFFQSQEFKNLTDSFGVTQILPTDKPNLTGVESYVDRFYRLVLKRNYDENGFNDWVKQLTNKTKNPTEIANGFLFSPEYTNQNEDNQTFLDTCYQAFFGRASDEGGKNDWLNKITNQGYTRQQIFEGFTGSQEFTNLVNSFNLDNLDNDAPTITSTSTFSVNENQTNAFTITATDDTTVTYSISGTDSSLFNVNATTGVVTFKTAPDYETKRSYSLTVRVMDSSNNVSTKNVTVNISNLSDTDTTAPTITSATTFSVNENQTNAFTITATDNSTITYSLSGTDSSLFNVNATTGVVTFKTAPDYETKRSYSLTVRVMDSSNNVSTKNVTVNISNLSDTDTTAPTITSTSTFTVNENQTNAFTITATDNSTITYSLSGTDSSLFNVNATTGVVTFKTAPDYETKRSYSLTVRVMDSSNNVSTKNVTVNISNLSDTDTTAPTITSATTFSVNENQTNAFTITATDNSTITYSLSGTDSSLFNVNATTGVVTFKTAPDYETKRSYSLTVRVMDSSNNVSTKNVTVNISNLSDTDTTAPTITSATTFSVNENQTNAFTITATDNSTITYSLSGTDSSLFNVNATTGVVTFKTAPDYETKRSYSLTVRVMDSSNNVSTKNVTVNILNVNEALGTVDTDDNSNTQSGATQVFLNSQTQGNLEVSDDVDYFKFELTAKTTISIKSLSTSSIVNYDIYRSGSSTELFSSLFNKLATKTDKLTLDAGTYYIKVHSLLNEITGYSIKINGASAVVDTDDNSNTQSGATQVFLNSQTQGNLEVSDDVDYFKFELTAKTTISIESLSTSSIVNYDIYRSGSSTELFSSLFNKLATKTDKLTLDAGTYYIKVHSLLNEITGYSIKINIASAVVDTDDNSNTQSGATQVFLNSQTQGNLEVSDDVDYFKFELTAKTTISIESLSTSSIVNYDIYRSDSSTELFSSLFNKLATKTDKLTLDAGTYYIKVHSLLNEITGYSIKINGASAVVDTDDNSNTQSGATQVFLNSQTQGNLEVSDDVDYFKFELTAKTTISIESLSTSSIVNYDIYRSGSSTELFSSLFNKLATKTDKLTLDAGTYYIKVHSLLNEITGYSIKINIASAVVDTDDNSNTQSGATQVFLNSQTQGNLEVSDDVDYFKFELTAKTTISIESLSTSSIVNYDIYRSDSSTELFSSLFNKLATKTDKLTLDAGTYYIKVHSLLNEITGYSITIK